MELAAAAIGAIVPYVVKGAEEFAKAVGKEAAGAVGSLFQRLSRWWAGNSEAKSAADHLPKRPERYEAILTDLLAEALSQDPALAEDVRSLMRHLEPHLVVIQKIDYSQEVTGAKIEKMRGGSVRVEQEGKVGRNVVGAEIDEFG